MAQKRFSTKAETDTAQTTATNAATAASNAQTTANSAVTAAGNAQTTANGAVTAAGTAQTTANNANTAAGNAQTTANNANTAAGQKVDKTTDKASDAEVSAGSNDAKYVTPSKLSNSKYLDQNGGKDSVVLVGTDNYTGSLTPAISAYTSGMRVKIYPVNANTGACTLNINGVGVKPIQKSGGTLQLGDIPAGQWQDLTYSTSANGGNGAWQLTTAIYNKLNTAANATLAGSGNSVVLISADGTIYRDVNMTYDPATRKFTIGSNGITANLEIVSNEFKLKVQENITSGNAHIEFNDNQDRALVFNSTDGKEYIAFRSTDNDEAVILFQKYIFDQSVGAALNTIQGQVTTSSTAKTYFTDSLGAIVQIPFGTDNISAVFSGLAKGHNSTGQIGDKVLAATFRVAVNRIGGVITVKGNPMSYICDENLNGSAATNFVVGVESVDNSNLRMYVQVVTSPQVNIAWKVGELKYFSS